jgi:hypothetical protein
VDAAVPVPSSFVVHGVIAQRLEAADRSDMLAIHQDSAVMATLGGIRDQAATDRYMAVNLEHWQRSGFGIYRLSDPRDRALLGRAGLRTLCSGSGPMLRETHDPSAAGTSDAPGVGYPAMAVLDAQRKTMLCASWAGHRRA